MKIKSTTSKKTSIRIAVIAAIVLVIAFVGFFVYSQSMKIETDTQSPAGEKSVDTSTQSPTTKTEDNPTKVPEAVKEVDASVTPTTPEGTFISNHHPNKSGTPAPSVVSSTCTTTPGVECTIQFKKGATTVSLVSKTTDSSGNTSWEWNVNELGLGIGEWTVTAIATNGSKVTTATDALKLSVGE